MKIERCGFTIHYKNFALLEGTLKDIFEETHYTFETSKVNPVIIDAGSSIGLATLFFKKHYPESNIICFEPDPNSFSLLRKNMECNNINGVTLINAALAKEGGHIDFYGQIFSDTPDSRGNSILDAWANQRVSNDKIAVEAVKLSSYINTDIDLLKLDIEGAEQQVLEDLREKFYLIKEIILEVHCIDKINEVNSLSTVMDILEKNNYEISCVEKDISAIPVAEASDWIKNNAPRLFMVRARRKSQMSR